MHSWGLHRITTALVAVALPLGIVAAFVKDDASTDRRTDDDTAEEVEVDTGGSFLAQAADATSDITHLRYEMLITYVDGGDTFGPTRLADGAVAGDRTRMTMSIEELAGEIGDEIPADFGMEIVTDPTATYLHAPMFAAIAETDEEPMPEFMQPLVDLGDRWGRIDNTALAMTATDMANTAFGSSSMDLPASLDLVRAVADDAVESGAGQVAGVDVTFYEGSILYEELLDMGSQSVDVLDGLLEDLPPDIDASTLLDAMMEAPLDLEVGVDADGLVRRVAFTLDEGFFGAVGEVIAPDEEVPDLSMTNAIELRDVGDPSITVDLPAVDDYVDLTPWALELSGIMTD